MLQVVLHSAFLIGNGNLWNGKGMFKVLLCLSTSGEIKSICRPNMFCYTLNLLSLNKASNVSQLGWGWEQCSSTILAHAKTMFVVRRPHGDVSVKTTGSVV